MQLALLGAAVWFGGSANAASLPAWMSSGFASIEFTRTNCQVVFLPQGARYSITIQQPGKLDEATLSEYNGTLEVPYGTQAKLNTRGSVVELGSLGIAKPGETNSVSKSLCEYTGVDRRHLCLDVPAFAFFKRVDMRSLGKGLTEYRAIVVPTADLSESEIARVETLLGQKFKATVHKGPRLMWVTCEKSQE